MRSQHSDGLKREIITENIPNMRLSTMCKQNTENDYISNFEFVQWISNDVFLFTLTCQ